MATTASFTLEVQGKPAVPVSRFTQVERALRSLKPYGARTYAILEHADGSFLQVAGGQVSACVERHDKTGHWRAYLPEAHPNYTTPITKSFGAGKLVVQPDEILWIEEVVRIFADYFSGQHFSTVNWRELDWQG